MKRLFLLLLVISPALLAQTSKTGRIMTGTFETGPGLPIPCSASDQWNTTNGHGAYLCINTNSWQQIGGGGSNYQLIQTSGTPVATEPILNFTNIPCVDNPGSTRTDCTASYQFVLNNATVLAQEPRWNAVPPLVATDNGANTRTDLSIAACTGGASHTAGILGDPGVSPDLTKFWRSDCTLAVPPGGGGGSAVPNPTTSANLSNATAPWAINVDTAFQGPNPSVNVRAYGVRAVNPFSTPAATGLTVNISSGSPTATISAASTFVNGDGVVIYGAGATHAMSTPAAPTVTPSVASSLTGTGFVKTAPTGAQTKCYKIAARDTAGGLTAASAEQCTTTGNTLGSNSVTISTLSRSNNTVTVVTSSPHGLVTGAMVYIKGTSVESQFGGWYTVAGSADNTHFTLSTGNDTHAATGAASATGGTAYWFNSNHLVLPAPGAGVYEYVIYAGGSGAETLLGVTYPAVSGISADPTYMVYDDFGSPMMDGISLPAFIPTTPPGSATADNLVTTISSGAGTTTLTLAANAGNNVTGATIRFDNTPNIVAAFNAAKNTTGGMVYFPAVTIAGNLNYVTNSFLELSSFPITGVSQSGNIFLGDTMHLPTGIQWHGDLTPSQLTYPSFAITAGTDINTASAYPGIWTAGGNYSGINIHSSSPNAYLGFFLAMGNIPTATFTNMNFYGGSATDYMGIPFYGFTQFSAGGTAGLKFTNCLFSTGPTQTDGTTATPLFITKNYGEINFDGLFLNRRGIFLDPNQSGQTAEINMGFEEQGGIMPMFTITPGAGGFPTGWVHLRNTILDTMDHPLFASLQSVFGGKILIDGTTFPLGAFGNVPLISGLPLFNAEVTGGGGANISLTGQNTNITVDQEGNILDGIYGTTPVGQALRQVNEHVSIGGGYSLFTATGQPSAPTCSVVAAGPPFTLAGSYTFKYGAAYPPNNGVGPLSPASSTCTADGSTQQITLTVPSAIAGATGYTWWRNGQMITCSSPSSTTTSFVWTGSACGPSESALAGGGPAGINGGSSWSNTGRVGQYIDFAGLGSAPSNPASGYCRTYYDSVAGTTKGINSSGASCSPTGGGGGGTGTVIPALQNSVTYYDQAGSIAHVAGVPGPTGPNSVPSFWVTVPAAGVATVPQPFLAGVPGRVSTGAGPAGDAAIVFGDRVNRVKHTNAGVTDIRLPGAGTTNFGSSFCYKEKVVGSGAVDTITPASGTINGAGSLVVLQGQDALVCSYDNSNYEADPHDPPLIAGSNITLTRSDAGLTVASTAGGGTVTHTAGALTSGQLIVGNAAADVKTGDLTGDVTTSGSTATTVTAIRGTSFAGTNGDLVSFGAANIPADSGIVGTNVITSTGTLLAGNVVSGTAAKNVGPTSISTANLVTSTSNAGFANQICASGSTDKTCAYTSLTDLSSTNYGGATTGAVNTLAGCPTNTATALTAGMTVSFLPNLANTTTTPTFNLCTLGAKTITKAPGISALVANDLVTTAIAVARYDGTEWQLQNPQTSSGGGGSTAVSSLTAAAASNTIANGNFPQTWNWAQTSNSQSGITLGETSAATAGTVTSNLALQANVKISTAAASTAAPLSVVQGSQNAASPAIPAAQFKTTWNNSGLIAQGMVISVIDTFHGTGSKLFNVFGGSGGTTSLMSVDPSGNLTVGSCTGCGTADSLNTPAVSRWGTNVWSHGNGGITRSGAFALATGVQGATCGATQGVVAPGDIAASNTDPPYATCTTGATVNNEQNQGYATGDLVVGNVSNPTNINHASYFKHSATTAIRVWPIVLTDQTATTLSTTDSANTWNIAAIRYSSVAADVTYQLLLCNPTNVHCTKYDTTVTATNTVHHFALYMNDVLQTAKACVDGVCVSGSTDYPNTFTVSTTGSGWVGDNTTSTSLTFSWSELGTTTIR